MAGRTDARPLTGGVMTPPASGGTEGGTERPRYGRIAVMTAAHFINDSYGQYLQILLPLLAVSIGFDLGRAGIIVTIYTITSAIIQPLLGHVADRHPTRLISVFGIAASAVGASLLGVAPSFIVLALLALVAGLGTAAYHPQAAAMVNAISAKRKSSLMSLYLVGGSVGFALGPKLVSVVARHSLHATPLLMLPGLLMAAALLVAAPRSWQASGLRDERRPSLWSTLWQHRRVLTLLLGVIILRSWAQQGVTTFLPFYYRHQGYGAGHAADVLTVFGLVGAAGGLAGGFIAERTGQKPVAAVSLILAGPLLFALPALHGLPLFLDAALAGALLLASWNVLAVKGQMLLANNVGVASGLVLGFSIGIGGLGVIPLGFAGDRTGILPVLLFCAALAPLGGLLALWLPD